jgi:hypothetical protein
MHGTSTAPLRRPALRPAHSTLASLSLAASGLAALALVFESFAHGIWLVAYLFLVGFTAQLLLGRGQAALIAAHGRAEVRLGAQIALWNAGVILVPAGVLLEARLLVVIGGITLLAALVSFTQSVRETRPSAVGGLTWQWPAQVALIVFMAFSVLVGTALAWDTPWV